MGSEISKKLIQHGSEFEKSIRKSSLHKVLTANDIYDWKFGIELKSEFDCFDDVVIGIQRNPCLPMKYYPIQLKHSENENKGSLTYNMFFNSESKKKAPFSMIKYFER